MKELKALEILENPKIIVANGEIFAQYVLLDIDEAIAELEALQAPKTCTGCGYSVDGKPYYKSLTCMGCARNIHRTDCYETEDAQC